MPKFYVHMLAALDGAGTPAYTFQTGAGTGTITDTGTGDAAVLLGAADGIDSGDSIMLLTPRVAHSTSNLRSLHAVHTSDTSKQVTGGQEGASGGASAAADIAADLAIIGVGTGLDAGMIVAAGAVAYSSGVPAYTWQYGMSGTITDTGTGDMELLLAASHGFDSTECVILCTSRSTYTASRNVGVSVVHTSDISKQVTVGREAASAGQSVASDSDFDFVIFAPGKMAHSPGGLHIAAGGVVNVSATPTFDVNGGLASASQTATGDYAVTLDEAVDSAECAIIATPLAVYAASGLTCIHTQHDSDTVKAFQIGQEAAMGGASALTDVDFGFIVVKAALG